MENTDKIVTEIYDCVIEDTKDVYQRWLSADIDNKLTNSLKQLDSKLSTKESETILNLMKISQFDTIVSFFGILEGGVILDLEDEFKMRYAGKDTTLDLATDFIEYCRENLANEH